jgi:hypothetical protein
MAEVFVNMPSDRIPLLEEAWRKDLVALYRDSKEAQLQNCLKGSSCLKTLTPDYIFLQITAGCTLELKLLPLADTATVLCMVTTIGAPVLDSHIEFFTPDWTPLPSDSFFTPPNVSSFLLSGDLPPDSDHLDISLIHYQLHSDTFTLTATLTTPLYLSEDQRKSVSPFLASPKTYVWNGLCFK